MKDYAKPSLRENPEHFILHVETNDLDSNRSPELIANLIVDVACLLKNESHDVSVLSLVFRNDKSKVKVTAINGNLRQLCIEKNLFLIDLLKTIKVQHLKRSKVHLTRNGSNILGNNFGKAISNTFVHIICLVFKKVYIVSLYRLNCESNYKNDYHCSKNEVFH